jgi:hypothetical protein
MIDEEECLKEEKESLQRVEQDLAEGKVVVRTEKRKLRRTRKSKLKKKNAERALDTLEKGVEATEERLGLLERNSKIGRSADWQGAARRRMYRRT